jgi:hypothetical protein
MEIFTDPLVLQHKLLALVPLTYGVIGMLRSAGAIASSYWYAIVPTLAILAGASLFVHFHDGRFHVDEIYLQHAAMGLTAIAAGALIFWARRTVRGGTLIRWAGPGSSGRWACSCSSTSSADGARRLRFRPLRRRRRHPSVRMHPSRI